VAKDGLSLSNINREEDREMAKKNEVMFTIKLDVTRMRMQELLDAATYDGKPLTVDEVVKAGRLKEFIAELDAPTMLEEYVENSDDAIANGWLEAFCNDDEDED
tara:strand:+ start:479 stop:790 length:312 start_codon:yes stop_codon:yes gene_type:complete